MHSLLATLDGPAAEALKLLGELEEEIGLQAESDVQDSCEFIGWTQRVDCGGALTVAALWQTYVAFARLHVHCMDSRSVLQRGGASEGEVGVGGEPRSSDDSAALLESSILCAREALGQLRAALGFGPTPALSRVFDQASYTGTAPIVPSWLRGVSAFARTVGTWVPLLLQASVAVVIADSGPASPLKSLAVDFAELMSKKHSNSAFFVNYLLLINVAYNRLLQVKSSQAWPVRRMLTSAREEKLSSSLHQHKQVSVSLALTPPHA